jgi:catechol 2,3-dioxygenase-like lactoylglutathione lyase family enzyme
MKTAPVWLWLTLAFAADKPIEAHNDPPFTAIGGFVAISVPDLRASATWYSEKLGLKVVMEAPQRNTAAAVVLEGGGFIVELIQRNDAVPATEVVHGITKAGIIVENLDSLLTTLRLRGVEIAYGPFPAQENQRANVIVRDNAGNLLQFFAR